MILMSPAWMMGMDGRIGVVGVAMDGSVGGRHRHEAWGSLQEEGGGHRGMMDHHLHEGLRMIWDEIVPLVCGEGSNGIGALNEGQEVEVRPLHHQGPIPNVEEGSVKAHQVKEARPLGVDQETVIVRTATHLMIMDAIRRLRLAMVVPRYPLLWTLIGRISLLVLVGADRNLAPCQGIRALHRGKKAHLLHAS